MKCSFGQKMLLAKKPSRASAGLLCDLRATNRPVPHERWDPVEGEGVEVKDWSGVRNLPSPIHNFLAPQPVQQVIVLDCQGVSRP